MNALSQITKRHVLNALFAAPLLFSCAYASAEDAAPAADAAAPAAAAPAEPAPPFTLSFNIGLYSNYMFRGVDTAEGTALQGGIDIAHSSGLFAGTWWSNIDPYWTGKGDGFSEGNHLETDWYAGYAHTFDNGFGVSLMGNYYYYPDNENSYTYLVGSTFSDGSNQDTFETSIALSYKWLTYTLYYIPTDYYGAAASGTKDGTDDTSGATYNELKLSYTLPGDFNLLARVGYQHTPNLAGSQGDYQVGLSKNFSLPGAGKPIEGFNAGAYYTNTFNVENQAYYISGNGRDVNGEKVTFYVKRTW
jgi:uncharacterized protein (TIGR02001 family)